MMSTDHALNHANRLVTAAEAYRAAVDQGLYSRPGLDLVRAVYDVLETDEVYELAKDIAARFNETVDGDVLDPDLSLWTRADRLHDERRVA